MTVPAAIPTDEAWRIERLHALAILDTPPEALFDALVRVAAEICGVPVSLVSLVDSDRQWFKANVGLTEATETPRDIAFCSHALLGDDVMEVGDATKDIRFAGNPLVTQSPGIRFYAGAPLCTSDGLKIGTLCVIDREPRQLSPAQLSNLRSLATAVMQGLEFRERAMQAVKTLADSEAHQAALYATTPTMLHSIDAAGRITAVSDFWLREMGYQRAEVLGRVSSDFLSAESQSYMTQEVLPAFFQRGYCEGIEYLMVRKDGSSFEAMLSATLERDANGDPLRSMAVIKNISARKQAERDRTESARFATTVIDNVLEGIITTNADGNVGSFNPEASRIFGYTAEEMLGQNIKILMPPGDTGNHDAYLRNHPITGASKVVGKGNEQQGRRKDGTLFPIEFAVSRCERAGEPFFIAVLRDISERKEMESRLRDSHELLQVTLDSIADAVITTDKHSVIQWMNPVAEQLTGWTKSEASGKLLTHVFSIINEDTRKTAEDPITMCLKHGRTMGLADDTVLISRSGMEYAVEDSAAPIRDSDGNLQGAVLVFRDVSEQRRLSREMTHRAKHDALTVPGQSRRVRTPDGALAGKCQG